VHKTQSIKGQRQSKIWFHRRDLASCVGAENSPFP
jgi:hypothetical protein